MNDEQQTPHIYAAIFSLALLTFMGILNETAMNVTYPELATSFHVSLDVTQWITTGYLLMVTIVMGTTAYLLRQFPAKRLHLLAVTMFIIGCVIGAVSINFPMLLIGRVIQAIATGLSTPILFQLIFTEIPINQKGMMTGVAGMIISFAPAIGPTYGGVVAETLSWRMIFWILLPFVLISLYLGQRYIQNEPTGNEKPFSYAGLFWLAIAICSAIYSFSTIGRFGFSVRFALFLLIALVALLIFLMVNRHGQSQLLDLAIFKIVPIRLSTLTYFNCQFINIGISLVIPVYAQYALGTSSMIAGLVLLPGSLIGALIAPLGGRWADQRGFAKPVITGATMMVIGTACFVITQAKLTPILIMAFFIILRAGFNLTFSTTISNASMIVPTENASDVNSVFNMVQQFAGSTGTSLLTAIIALQQNHGIGSIVARTFSGGQIDFYILLFLASLTLLIVIVNFNYQNRLKRLNDQ